MRTRLAAVALHRGEGPWLNVKGDEHGVCVYGLKVGEVLVLESIVDDQQNVPIPLQEGDFFDFPRSAKRFRFVKTVEEGIKPSPTSIQVLII